MSGLSVHPSVRSPRWKLGQFGAVYFLAVVPKEMLSNSDVGDPIQQMFILCYSEVPLDRLPGKLVSGFGVGRFPDGETISQNVAFLSPYRVALSPKQKRGSALFPQLVYAVSERVVGCAYRDGGINTQELLCLYRLIAGIAWGLAPCALLSIRPTQLHLRAPAQPTYRTYHKPPATAWNLGAYGCESGQGSCCGDAIK